MTVIQNGEDYEKYFDPDHYLEYFYSKTGHYQCSAAFVIQILHKIFSDGNIKGKDLLDVGSGPTIHGVLSASNYVDNIYLSDFAEKNLDILKSWWKGKRPLQENIIQEVCQMENKGESLAKRVERIQKKVKGIFQLDILNLQSISQSDVPKNYDVIISGFCLESAVTTVEDYFRCVSNVNALLKPGGYFVTLGDLEEAVLRVDTVIFKGAYLNSKDLKEVFSKAGFEMKFYTEHHHVSEGKTFAIVAKRK